jgi:endogenous inhibitor of DNA gyrase (YacG/DUF329 family)
MIDLGNWASEEYAVPAEEAEPDSRPRHDADERE